MRTNQQANPMRFVQTFLSHRRLISLWAPCVAVVMSLLTPAAAWAQRDKPERDPFDARLEGYGTNVYLDGGGTSLTWLLFAVLGIICLVVLFKDARRSHLD
ncbi:MAG: hypothetical protein ACREIT_12365 [Tepidisphaeraceae bacterium]